MPLSLRHCIRLLPVLSLCFALSAADGSPSAPPIGGGMVVSFGNGPLNVDHWGGSDDLDSLESAWRTGIGYHHTIALNASAQQRLRIGLQAVYEEDRVQLASIENDFGLLSYGAQMSIDVIAALDADLGLDWHAGLHAAYFQTLGDDFGEDPFHYESEHDNGYDYGVRVGLLWTPPSMTRWEFGAAIGYMQRDLRYVWESKGLGEDFQADMEQSGAVGQLSLGIHF